MALERLGKAAAGSDAGQTGSFYSLLKDIGSDLVSQGKRIPEDISILFSLAEIELANGLNDDKKYFVSFNRWQLKQKSNRTTLIFSELID